MRVLEVIDEHRLTIINVLLVFLCVILSLYIIQLKDSVFQMCRLYCDVQGGLPISNGFSCSCLVKQKPINISGLGLNVSGLGLP